MYHVYLISMIYEFGSVAEYIKSHTVVHPMLTKNDNATRWWIIYTKYKSLEPNMQRLFSVKHAEERRVQIIILLVDTDEIVLCIIYSPLTAASSWMLMINYIFCFVLDALSIYYHESINKNKRIQTHIHITIFEWGVWIMYCTLMLLVCHLIDKNYEFSS